MACVPKSIPTWKLELLRYPRVALFSMNNEIEIVGLVTFLEDRHIRMWAIEERAPLRKSGPGWLVVFESYLKVWVCVCSVSSLLSL